MICPKCNKRCETTHDLDGEKVAVCDGCGDVWRLSTALEFARRQAADARLGRLVRNGLGSWRNLAVRRICKNSVKWWVEDEWSHGTRKPAYGEGDTPEAALDAAGVKEGEG